MDEGKWRSSADAKFIAAIECHVPQTKVATSLCCEDDIIEAAKNILEIYNKEHPEWKPKIIWIMTLEEYQKFFFPSDKHIK